MIFKIIFDYILALILLIFLVGLIVLLIIVCSIDTNEFGLFTQNRVGKHAKIFRIYKLRTMKGISKSIITTTKDHNITTFGKFLRKYKLDELPQLLNILKGEMSFVGPRPDVVGYADKLIGEDRLILTVKPGITGPAQIKYKNEEELLAKVENPIQYNDEVLWKDKVSINIKYVKEWSFKKDILYLLQTLFKQKNASKDI